MGFLGLEKSKVGMVAHLRSPVFQNSQTFSRSIVVIISYTIGGSFGSAAHCTEA